MKLSKGFAYSGYHIYLCFIRFFTYPSSTKPMFIDDGRPAQARDFLFQVFMNMFSFHKLRFVQMAFIQDCFIYLHHHSIFNWKHFLSCKHEKVKKVAHFYPKLPLDNVFHLYTGYQDNKRKEASLPNELKTVMKSIPYNEFIKDRIISFK